jgi:CBS domain-containing protein
MEHLDTFLARHPPFDALAPAELAAVSAQASEVFFEVGEAALVEDGRPTAGLFVILSGAMDLVHEGEVVQVLEPGECFGHPSLLTGMAPAFTVRARAPSPCALLPGEAAMRVLATEAGARYVATTMRTRLTRTGHTVHGLLDVGTTPVSAIMRPAVFCEPDAPLREAAGKLDQPGVSALLLRIAEDGGGNEASGVAILTDADVRAWVAHGGGSLDAPARAAARRPVPTVPVAQLAIEATVDMLAAGSDHMAVRDGETLCGTLSATDLLGLDARSPIALRHTILGAADETVLASAATHLPQLFRLLVRAGVPPRDLGRVLSLQHDALVARLIDFSISRHGPAPVPWAWLDLGSSARREFTLGSDQDNALAYATPEPGAESEVDAHFERMGSEVNDGLARCGFGVDNNDVLAGNAHWRMSKADWLRTFEEVLRAPTESRLLRASVAFDFRAAAGGLPIAASLSEQIRTAREHPDFMRLMARTATGYPVALTFHGSLAVERHGDAAGRLDLKARAIVPLVNLVRFHALANGVTISPTLDRIEAVASVGGLERAEADALAEAFEAIARLRFERHAELIAAGAPPDNLIDPGALAPIARTELREALHTVRRGQKRLGAWLPAGL